MLKAAEDKGLSTIYYLDLSEERDVYQYEDNKLIRSAKGTEAYFKLLELLDGYLEPYIIYDKAGRAHHMQEKRIQIPFLLAVRDGNVVAANLGTYELEEKQSKYDGLTERQYVGLYRLFCRMYDSLQS